MTTHALSDNWLTDALETKEEGIEGPFLPGHKVRIREFIGPEYPDGAERRWFYVYVDEDQRVVFQTDLREVGQLICSDHPVAGSCECRDALRRYLESENE